MKTFDLARNALKYLIEEYEIEEIFIPHYLCNVIRKTVFKMRCKPVFYHIDNNFMPIEKFPTESFICYPNYFGVCSNNVDKLIEIYPKLIIDNAHAFYATPVGFASFNSSRKFLKEDKGAFLFIGKEKNNYPPDFKRRHEFDRLHKIYGAKNNLKISLKENDIPFCYPYLAKTVEEADNLAKYLKSQNKTIYRYWDKLPVFYNEYKFYSRLVPIPLE